MRKIVFRVALILLVTIFAGLLGLHFWLRSDHFHALLRGKLDNELKKYNLALTAGKFHVDALHLQAEFNDLKISVRDEPQPFLTARHLFVKVRARDLLARKFELDNLVIDEPRIYVDFDSAGRSNLSRITLPSANNKSDDSLLSGATMILEHGQIVYGDARVDFSSRLDGFKLSALPAAGGGSQINLLTRNSELKYQGRAFTLEKLNLRARLFNDKAELQALELVTSFGSFTASGEMRDWRKFDYDLNVYTKLDLANLTRIFSPQQSAAGTAIARGRVSGQGENYRFHGEIETTDLAARGLRARRLDLKSDVVPGKELFELSGNVALGGAQVEGVPVRSFQGMLWVTKGTLELKDFETELLGGRVRGAAQIALTEGASKLTADIEGLDLGTLSESLARRASLLAGRVNAKVELGWPGLNFTAIDGKFSGNFAGSTIPTAKQPRALPVSGTVTGAIAGRQVSLAGFDLASGDTRLSAQGSINEQTLKLRVKLETKEIQEARQLAEQAGLTIKENEPVMPYGRVSFDGEVEGATRAPGAKGRLFVERLTSGEEELGQFSGDIHYHPGTLSIKDAQLKQRQGGSVDIDLDTSLAVGGDTTANVRFQAFVVPAVAVKSGRDLALKARSLYLYKTLNSFSGELNGALNLKGLPSIGTLMTRKAEEASNESGVRVEGNQIAGQLDLNIKNSHPQASFRALAVNFSLENRQLNFTRINLGLPSGTIAGTAAYNARTGDYRVDLGSERLDLAGFAESLKERGLPASGIIAIQVQGAGNVSQPTLDLRLASSQLTVGTRALSDFEMTTRAAQGLANVRMKAGFLGRLYEIAGTVRLTDDFPVEAEVALKDRSIVPFIEIFAPGVKRLDVIASGNVKIRGPLATDEGIGFKQIKFITDLEKLRLEVKAGDSEEVNYVAVNDGPVVLEAMAGQVTVKSLNIKGEGTSFKVTGATGTGSKKPLELRGSINLRLLNTISNSLFVNGSAEVSASISPGGRALLSGSADLKDVSVRYIGLPLAVQEGQGRVLFTEDRAQIENFTAKSGSGQVVVGGGIVLEKLRPSRFRFDIKASSVRMNYPASLRSQVDGDLVLQGSPAVQVLSGTLNVRRAEYTEETDLGNLLINLRGASMGGDLRFGSLNLDIGLTAQDSLVIRNNLTDLIASASLRLTGPVNEPIISGRATVSRGIIILRNDRYNVTRGVIDFPATRTGRARFDIEADTELRGYRIILNIVGTLERFTPILRSEPSLPQPDIIALLTTGQLPTPGISSQSVESQTRLGTAVSILTETLTDQVEQRTGRLFGLNRFQIDPLLAGRGANPTARVTLGRRITRDLALTYSTDVTTGREQIVVIEYQINRNVSIIGTREQDGSYGVDIRFRKRF